jgi:hypothetical protein
MGPQCPRKQVVWCHHLGIEDLSWCIFLFSQNWTLYWRFSTVTDPSFNTVGYWKTSSFRVFDPVCMPTAYYTTQYSRTNKIHFSYSVYFELAADACFEDYLLIFRRRCINNSLYIACVLCRLAATRVGVEIQSNLGSKIQKVQLVGFTTTLRRTGHVTTHYMIHHPFDL